MAVKGGKKDRKHIVSEEKAVTEKPVTGKPAVSKYAAKKQGRVNKTE